MKVAYNFLVVFLELSRVLLIFWIRLSFFYFEFISILYVVYKGGICCFNCDFFVCGIAIVVRNFSRLYYIKSKNIKNDL